MEQAPMVDVKRGSELSPEELRELALATGEVDDEIPETAGEVAEDGLIDQLAGEGPPAWFEPPPGWTSPAGREVLYIRLKAEWTDTPKKGDRVIACWNLTEADEKLAFKRTMGDHLRGMDELTKQMIRSIDGHKADWTGKLSEGNVKLFWNDIGGRCRQLLKGIYAKRHVLGLEESKTFFDSCVVVRVGS